MPRIEFTPNLRRHLAVPTGAVDGRTVREVLENAFERNESLRGYILDDQGRLRQHVVIFIDGDLIADRTDLSDPVSDQAEVFVMQALSGG